MKHRKVPTASANLLDQWFSADPCRVRITISPAGPKIARLLFFQLGSVQWQETSGSSATFTTTLTTTRVRLTAVGEGIGFRVSA
jgi:hypothetical protein